MVYIWPSSYWKKAIKSMVLSAVVHHLIPSELIIYIKISTKNRNLFLHYGDLTDSSNLTRIIQEVQPDEIYNLAA